MSPVLRPAELEDVEFANACAEAAYSLYINRIGKRPAPMDQDFALAVELQELEILQLNSEKTGFVLSRQNNDILFIENIALLPSAQGKGLARWIIEHLEKRALAYGCLAAELYTNAKMHENLLLYAHLGFQETKRRREDGFDRVFFRKSLIS